ncbi:hypothetical protein GCM10010198_76230 [Nocardia seriolae]|uniref:flavodoxin domain-containing protein n=1 Tax=Nocardia seriolae TaxID=37332 RepID=UPI001192ED39|nr:hypothetical protein NS2_15670 [Nocardia seriolae NBRC 15557]
MVTAARGPNTLTGFPAADEAVRVESDKHSIAVVYASGRGSTAEIAEFIGAELTSRGFDVEVSSVQRKPDLSGFDTVVLGSAVYHGDFMPPLVIYAYQQLDSLVERDVRLFGVGLSAGDRNRPWRVFGAAVPKRIAMLRDALGAEDYRHFAGRYHRKHLPVRAQIRYFLRGGRRFGDLRDWADIRGWVADRSNSLTPHELTDDVSLITLSHSVIGQH